MQKYQACRATALHPQAAIAPKVCDHASPVRSSAGAPRMQNFGNMKLMQSSFAEQRWHFRFEANPVSRWKAFLRKTQSPFAPTEIRRKVLPQTCVAKEAGQCTALQMSVPYEGVLKCQCQASMPSLKSFLPCSHSSASRLSIEWSLAYKCPEMHVNMSRVVRECLNQNVKTASMTHRIKTF